MYSSSGIMSVMQSESAASDFAKQNVQSPNDVLTRLNSVNHPPPTSSIKPENILSEKYFIWLDRTVFTHAILFISVVISVGR